MTKENIKQISIYIQKLEVINEDIDALQKMAGILANQESKIDFEMNIVQERIDNEKASRDALKELDSDDDDVNSRIQKHLSQLKEMSSGLPFQIMSDTGAFIPKKNDKITVHKIASNIKDTTALQILGVLLSDKLEQKDKAEQILRKFGIELENKNQKQIK